MEFQHIPVLFQETMEGLNIRENGIYVDCTVGGGGHSAGILERLKGGRLIAIDQDRDALEAAKDRLREDPDRVTFIHDNFSHLDSILETCHISNVDGILMDIGVSSHQLDDGARGFSYHENAPLDMRMDQKADIPTAADIVNRYSQEELTEIFYRYGEERWAKRIAEFIVMGRNAQPLETTFDLVTLIKKAIPKKVRMQDKHPAKRVFQALRIEVNHELDVLSHTLDIAVDHLSPRGRLCVISFHSLEDRIVKNKFRELQKGCTCPPELPVCVCGNSSKVRIITNRPIQAQEEELRENPRARSAKLRIAEKREG